MKAPKLIIGYHSWGLVTTAFTQSVLGAALAPMNGIQSVITSQGPYVDQSRNMLVQDFLSRDADFLLMIDADIQFEFDAPIKTVLVAEKFEADVVWGNYNIGGCFSNSIFGRSDVDDQAQELGKLRPDLFIEDVYAGSTGWCLLRRTLLEEMKTSFPGPWHWFDRDVVHTAQGPIKLGEDIAFGRRVSQLGRKQVGYTGITLLHHKMTPQAPAFMADRARKMDPYVYLKAPKADAFVEVA